MVLPLIGLVIGVGVSVVRGGRFANVPSSHLWWLPALAVGLVLQVLLEVVPVNLNGMVVLLVLSTTVLLGFCVRNWYRPGIPLVAAGLSLNAGVMLLNRGMPVSPDAIESLGGTVTTPAGGRHHLLTEATHLPWLADVIPLPGPIPSVISVGDILLLLGIIPLVHALMTPDDPAARMGRRSLA